jgi:uncharacterized membrane protein
LGGIGAIFTVLGALSSVSSIAQYYSTSTNVGLSAFSGVVGLLGFIGFVLLLVSMYGFSKDYNERGIFNNILYGIVAAIIAGVFALIVLIILVLLNLQTLIPTLNPSTTVPSQVAASIMASLSPVLPFFGVISLLYVFFVLKAFNLLAVKSGVPLFKTGALLLLAGTIVSILATAVFAALASTGSLSYNTLSLFAIPGALVQDAGWAFLAMAFFRIVPPPMQTFTPPIYPPITGQVKYCSNCGTPNPVDAVYCTRCGHKLT